MVCHHKQSIYGVSSQARYLWCFIISKVFMVCHHNFFPQLILCFFMAAFFFFFFTHVKTYVNSLMIIVCLTPQLSVVKCLTLASKDLASEILQTVHDGSLH